MRHTKLLITAGIAVLLIAALSASAALAQGPSPWGTGGWGPGMMGNTNQDTGPANGWGPGAWARGMMDGFGNWGRGMMGGFGNWGRGMMGSYGNWGHGMMGSGMMQGWGNWGPGTTGSGSCPYWNGTTPTGDPLTLDEAQAIAEQYLAEYGNDDLEIAEIMQFSQNFYVEVHEASTGIGAFELLIDPYSGAVHPEPGPNMMWNIKYGHMGGAGMMGGWFRQPSGDMTVTADEAIAAAQEWLDSNLPGVNAGDEAEAFYGYYTIHTLTDGEISGMLSVNGYTGQVWYHNWHGDFIAMTGEHNE